jgi:hypothetical protein
MTGMRVTLFPLRGVDPIRPTIFGLCVAHATLPWELNTWICSRFGVILDKTLQHPNHGILVIKVPRELPK